MIPGLDSFLSIVEAIVRRVLIHSVYRRRITGVAMLLACGTVVLYALDPNHPFSDDPLLWLAWMVLHGFFWFFEFLFLCLISTYFILKEDILSFTEEEEEDMQSPSNETTEKSNIEERLSG
jgi:hypothetical protein